MSSLTHVRRRAARLVLVGAVCLLAGCASATHRPAPSRSGPKQAPVAANTRAASTPVGAPTPGDIRRTVPVRRVSVKPAVALSGTGDFGGRVTVRVTQISAATPHAQVRGEVSGPGLVLTLQIDNGSPAAINVGNVVVELSDSTGAPASPMSASPSTPFSGTLPAGAHTTGVYVYRLAPAHRKPVTLKVSYTTEAPVVVFVGDAP